MKKCIICGKTEKEFFLKAQDRFNPEADYTYKKCPNCNLVTLENVLNNKNFQAYNFDKNVSTSQKLVLNLFYHRLKKFKKSGDILDFGSGTGNLAKFLSDRGYNVKCFEIDKKSVDWLRNIQKLEVLKDPFKKKYDVIIMEQVLEHLPNPLLTLHKLKKCLNKGGIMMVSIPDINSLQARIFGKNWFHLDAPRHINHFYKDSFNLILHKEGLRILKKYYLNFHIDPTGWAWSMNLDKGTQNLKKLGNLARLLLFVPIVAISAIFKSTAYNLYILKNTLDK